MKTVSEEAIKFCCGGVIVADEEKQVLPPSLSSTVTLGLLLLHFDSRTIFFTCRSPSGRPNIMWLVVWGRDHRNCTHATIYIHTYKHELTTLHD